MRQFEIVNGVSGASYHRLLEFFASRAETYLFVVVNEAKISEECRCFVDELKSIGARAYYDNKWPGTTLLYGRKSLLIKGELTPEVFELILKKENALFSWRWPDSPEDLCLFDSRGDVLLSSTTHECFASVMLDDEDLALWSKDELLSAIELKPLK